MNEPSDLHGSHGEVLANYDTGKVVGRFMDPETGAMVVELHLDPEIAREFAASLTAASIAVEEYGKP